MQDFSVSFSAARYVSTIRILHGMRRTHRWWAPALLQWGTCRLWRSQHEFRYHGSRVRSPLKHAISTGGSPSTALVCTKVWKLSCIRASTSESLVKTSTILGFVCVASLRQRAIIIISAHGARLEPWWGVPRNVMPLVKRATFWRCGSGRCFEMQSACIENCWVQLRMPGSMLATNACRVCNAHLCKPDQRDYRIYIQCCLRCGGQRARRQVLLAYHTTKGSWNMWWAGARVRRMNLLGSKRGRWLGLGTGRLPAQRGCGSGNGIWPDWW